MSSGLDEGSIKVRTAMARISLGDMDVLYQIATVLLAIHVGLHMEEGLCVLKIVPADHLC